MIEFLVHVKNLFECIDVQNCAFSYGYFWQDDGSDNFSPIVDATKVLEDLPLGDKTCLKFIYKKTKYGSKESLEFSDTSETGIPVFTFKQFETVFMNQDFKKFIETENEDTTFEQMALAVCVCEVSEEDFHKIMNNTKKARFMIANYAEMKKFGDGI